MSCDDRRFDPAVLRAALREYVDQWDHDPADVEPTTVAELIADVRLFTVTWLAMDEANR